MSLKHCFAPVVDSNTRLLILGSLPGEMSLAQGQYYAHKQNRFWHLMGDVIGEALPHMNYDERLQALLDHRVGLWDVIAKARRRAVWIATFAIMRRTILPRSWQGCRILPPSHSTAALPQR